MASRKKRKDNKSDRYFACIKKASSALKIAIIYTTN